MKFSLVLATIGRTAELHRFLESLAQQTARDVELIVVDQNPDDRLVPLLSPYEALFPVRHLRARPGLSRARNVGLGHVTGEIVAFPDDDCWYPQDLLRTVSSIMAARPDLDGVTGRSVDADGRESAGRFATEASPLTTGNVFACAISVTVFLRQRAVRLVGEFDESLGVGSGTIFGSGEETDYLIRGIANGLKVTYVPDLVVHHPNPLLTYDAKARRRGFAYGCGMGRVLSKHRYPILSVGSAVLRPAAGAILALVTARPRKASYHLSVMLGRIRGLIG